ncbi:MAG: WYL domain-containing protein [Victivallaceae bacterium]
MPVSKKQLLRLIKFVAELKKNNYPNSVSFAEQLRQMDLYENLNVSCTARTVQRDIDLLKNEFNAPLTFDSEQHGYFLADKMWDFYCPSSCEDFITTSLLGARLAEDIVPQPLKGTIRDAVNMQLTRSNSEFLDNAFIESLIVASGISVEISPDIFKVILDGWRLRHAVKITYKSQDGKCSSKQLDVHVISFNKGIWYVKGRIENDKITVFAIHRITSAELTNLTFEIDKSIVEDVRRNGLFNYPKISGITLHCDASIAFYLKEQQKAKKFKVTPQPDGSLIIVLQPATEFEAIRWILAEGGKIRVIEPESIREKVVAAARKTVEINS